MALAEAGLVPFWYVVADASLTVTFWPVDVDRVKPAADALAMDLRVAADAGTAIEAIRTVAERLAGTG